MNKNLADLNRNERFTADFTNGTIYTVVSVSAPQNGQVVVEWAIFRTVGKPTWGRSVKPALTVATVV